MNFRDRNTEGKHQISKSAREESKTASVNRKKNYKTDKEN